VHYVVSNGWHLSRVYLKLILNILFVRNIKEPDIRYIRKTKSNNFGGDGNPLGPAIVAANWYWAPNVRRLFSKLYWSKKLFSSLSKIKPINDFTFFKNIRPCLVEVLSGSWVASGAHKLTEYVGASAVLERTGWDVV